MKSIFTDIYKSYNAAMSPILILNFHVKAGYYDVNVSPDKREFFLKDESAFLEKLQAHL